MLIREASAPDASLSARGPSDGSPGRAATPLGGVPHIARGHGPTADQPDRRVLTVAFAAVCFQPLCNQGVFTDWSGPACVLPPAGLLVLNPLCDAAVAVVVERQAGPCRERPRAARIVRAVNAYEEKARGTGPGGPLKALEEPRPGTAGDCAPDVVEALARVLAGDRLTLPAAG